MTRATPFSGHLGWWARSVLGWLAVLVALTVLVLTVVIPRLAGGNAYTVLTSSMEPTLPPGTLIIIRPVPPSDLAVGDVITYQIESGKPAVVTHRIIGVGYAASGEVTAQTQGDGSGAPDQQDVRAVQIRGKLWYAIPYLGYVNTWLTGQVRLVLLGVIIVGLVGYALWMFVSAARDRHRPREHATTGQP